MAWAAIGVGVASLAVNAYQTSEANSALDRAKKNMPQYVEDPEVAKRLEFQKSLLNARASGAAAAERNIYQSGANAMSNIQRGATDPNQVILGAGQVQGQTNEGFEKLQQLEEEDFKSRQQNLAAAQEASNAERARKFGIDQGNYQMGVQLTGQQMANNQALTGSLMNFGMGVGGLVQGAGGWKNAINGYTPKVKQ